MIFVGLALALIGAYLAGKGLHTSPDDPALVITGLMIMFTGGHVATNWTIKDIGKERIVVEPSPVPGFNAYFEQRGVTGWHSDAGITGWGSTQAQAEHDVRLKVIEWKRNRERLANTPKKVVDL